MHWLVDNDCELCRVVYILELELDIYNYLQGRMFLFVGIVMAVLQGGVVRRLPQGTERKAAMG